MNKRWEIKESNKTRAEEIENKFKLSSLVAKIISKKGLTDNEIEKFLKPTRNDFYDPFLMPDMDKAIDRIIDAIENKEKIVIYGDYDADGITSTTILKRFFRDRGLEVGTYIPNRLDEGYGLNEKAVKYIVSEGYKLMITVDCGITAIKEVKLANELGLNVIVTDHHEVAQDDLPDAVAVVDCKRKDNKYPFRELAGCGVAFKITQALCKKLNLNENESLKYLDITCVGTISDIVPLVDENRVIAKLGLMLVKQTKNIGLREVLNIAGYKKIDSNAISFGVSPRINACGRMGHQEDALELFLTDDPIEARALAQKLEEYNLKRQDTEKRIYKEALELIKEENFDEKECIVLGKEGWHHGVIGIVSSKVTESFFKPSILVCLEEDVSRGSGRSIPGFDMHEAVVKCSENLIGCGGHSMAVGLSMHSEKFEDFKKEFEEYAKEHITESFQPIINIDETITNRELSLDGIKELSLLEPFGESNPQPIIMYNGLKIASIRSLSEGKHLKLMLQDENLTFEAIGFGLGEMAEKYQIGDKIDIAGNLEINSFNNVEKIQINLKDLRKAI